METCGTCGKADRRCRFDRPRLCSCWRGIPCRTEHMKLHSITREAADCRAAWAAAPEATAGAHIHHEQPFEALTEPIENRIAYILSDKPKKEQALRLRLMRPVTAPAWAEYWKVRAAAWAEYEKVEDEYQRAKAAAWAEHQYEKATVAAWAEYEKATAPARAEYQKATAAAHARLCPTPDCPWDGGSIFG